MLTKWLAVRGIDPGHCVYLGNDVNDAECMALAGYAVAPDNAVFEIKAVADLVLRSSGGSGAVREFVDLLFAGDYLLVDTLAGDARRAQ